MGFLFAIILNFKAITVFNTWLGNLAKRLWRFGKAPNVWLCIFSNFGKAMILYSFATKTWKKTMVVCGDVERELCNTANK